MNNSRLSKAIEQFFKIFSNRKINNNNFIPTFDSENGLPTAVVQSTLIFSSSSSVVPKSINKEKMRFKHYFSI